MQLFKRLLLIFVFLFNIGCHSLFAATNEERCEKWSNIIHTTETRIRKLTAESLNGSETDVDIIALEIKFLLNIHNEFTEEYVRVCVI